MWIVFPVSGTVALILIISAVLLLIFKAGGNTRKAARRSRARKARAVVDTSPGRQPPLPYGMSSRSESQPRSADGQPH